MKIFVGREKQIDILENLWQSATKGEKTTVIIKGELGVGKTALLKNFRNEIQKKCPECFVCYGHCEESENEGYAVIVEALTALVTERTDKATLRLIAEIMGESAPSWLQLIPVIGPPVAAAVDIFRKAKKKYSHATSPDLPYNTMLQQFTTFVQRLTQHGPFLVVLDDMQWADPSSVGLVTHLARHDEELPLLLVVISRPPEASTYRNPLFDSLAEIEPLESSTTIDLNPLPRKKFDRLISKLLSAHSLSEEIMGFLYENTGGNPLFLEQIILDWKEDNILVKQESTWQLTRQIDAIEIPRNLRGLVEKRARRLSDDLYHILSLASIEGERFHSQVISEALHEDEDSIVRKLRRAEERHLLVTYICGVELPRGEVTNQYQFVPAFIRNFFYTELTDIEHIRYHHQIGKAIERIWSNGRGERVTELALHFKEARKWDKALEYLVAAARHNQERYANQDALINYEEALGMLDKRFFSEENSWTSELYGSIYGGLGSLRLLKGDFFEAESEIKKALNFYKKSGNELEEAKQLTQLIRVYVHLHAYREAEKYVEKALETYERLDIEGIDKLNLLALVGWVYVDLAYPLPEVFKIFSDADNIMREIESRRVLYYANEVGYFYRRFGYYTKCQEISQWALELSRQYQDRRGEELNLRDLGFISLVEGKYSDALRQLTRAREIAHDIEARHDEGLILDDLSLLYLMANELDKALTIREEAFNMFREIRDSWHIAFDMTCLGFIRFQRGELSGARRLCQDGFDLFGKIGSKHRSAWALGYLGLTELDAEEVTYAITQLEEIGDKASLSELLRYLGVIHCTNNQPELAVVHLNRALVIHEQLGNKAEMIQDLRELLKALIILGESEKILKNAHNLQALYQSLEVSSNPCFETFQQKGLEEVDSALADYNAGELV